jgi:hypothetical protein
VNKHRTKDLLGDIEAPNLERSLRPFPPAFIDEREQSQSTERALDK